MNKDLTFKRETKRVFEQVFGKKKSAMPTPNLASSSPPSSYKMKYSDYDIDDSFEFNIKYTQWSTSDGSVYFPTGKTVGTLSPGVYEIDRCEQGIFFEKIPIKTEGIIKFPDTKSGKVVEEVQNFWEKEEAFKKYNLTYKRGIILYGPPGSGKTTAVQLIMKDVVDRNGIVIEFHHPGTYIEGLRKLRQIQPDVPVVTIMEDIDSLLEMYSETEILNILDGVNEINKVVFLATTNYPDKLGHRIINRPSRFDKRFRIGFPSGQSRRIYFEHLLKGESPESMGVDLDRWVKDTDKFSIAHLKELFVAVVILGDKYDDAIETLSLMREEVKDVDYHEKMGFGATTSDPNEYD